MRKRESQLTGAGDTLMSPEPGSLGEEIRPTSEEREREREMEWPKPDWPKPDGLAEAGWLPVDSRGQLQLRPWPAAAEVPCAVVP